MPSPKLEYTPVVAPGKRKVHALTLRFPTETACGEPAAGFRVARRDLTCVDCQLACGKDARPRRSR